MLSFTIERGQARCHELKLVSIDELYAADSGTKQRVVHGVDVVARERWSALEGEAMEPRSPGQTVAPSSWVVVRLDLGFQSLDMDALAAQR